MKVLVIGATGTVGSEVVKAFSAERMCGLSHAQ
jgi:uncharacterized protein YbjT (DUF2867 family)